jgi:hypothetical protein
MTVNGITGREEEKSAHNRYIIRAKVERLHSARFIRRDPKATKLDMQSL